MKFDKDYFMPLAVVVVVSLLSVLFLSCQPQPITTSSDVVTTEDSYPAVFDAVYKIECLNGAGSGWAISNHCIVTAAHVVDEDDILYALSATGKHVEINTVLMDLDTDIAFLYTEDDLPRSLTITLHTPRMTDTIRVWGWARSNHKAVSTGTLFGWASQGALIADATVQPGMSGGPVTDTHDRVVGIINATSSGYGRPVGICQPIELVLSVKRKLEAAN
jgi:S1-C subfamily serine protease